MTIFRPGFAPDPSSCTILFLFARLSSPWPSRNMQPTCCTTFQQLVATYINPTAFRQHCSWLHAFYKTPNAPISPSAHRGISLQKNRFATNNKNANKHALVVYRLVVYDKQPRWVELLKIWMLFSLFLHRFFVNFSFKNFYRACFFVSIFF